MPPPKRNASRMTDDAADLVRKVKDGALRVKIIEQARSMADNNVATAHEIVNAMMMLKTPQNHLGAIIGAYKRGNHDK